MCYELFAVLLTQHKYIISHWHLIDRVKNQVLYYLHASPHTAPRTNATINIQQLYRFSFVRWCRYVWNFSRVWMNGAANSESETDEKRKRCQWKVNKKKKRNFKSVTWLKFTKCLNKCSCEGESSEVSNESHNLLSHRDKKTNGNSNGGIVSGRESCEKAAEKSICIQRLFGGAAILRSSLWCINNEPKHFISVSIALHGSILFRIERGNSFFFRCGKLNKSSVFDGNERRRRNNNGQHQQQ